MGPDHYTRSFYHHLGDKTKSSILHSKDSWIRGSFTEWPDKDGGKRGTHQIKPEMLWSMVEFIVQDEATKYCKMGIPETFWGLFLE